MLGLNVVHLLKKKCIFLGKHIQPFIVCRTNFPERKVLRGHKILFQKRFETLMFHPRWHCKEALKRCAKKVENSQVGKVLSLVLYYWKRGPFLQTSSDDKSFFQFLEQLFFSSSTFLDDNRCSFIFSYSYCVNRYDIHS